MLTDLGGYQTMLDHYMPIFWYLLAGNLALAQTRFSPDGGVDRYFLQMAKADGTEILDEPLTPEEEAAAEEFGRTLVTDRNAVMIRAADEALRAGKNVFYIVGIAHMLGEDGIVEGLRQLGYTVTQVSYAS